MATIKYKGMVLEEITEPQIFDPPRECVVWDYNIGESEVTKVLAILPESSGMNDRVYTPLGTFKRCAILPEKPAPRRVTNRELAKWLAQGNGEIQVEGEIIYSTHHYNTTDHEDNEDDEVWSNIKVRKWDDTEWHEPTVDYLGIEDKEHNA